MTKIISNSNAATMASIAGKQAQKSPCLHRLGAVLTYGRKKPICVGYNNNMRTSYLGKINCCQHAEMAVATKFIQSHVNRNQIKVACPSF